MRAGRFVGRVGGLAVALGVGAAVSFGAPAAWAEGSESGSSEGSTGAAGATNAQETSEADSASAAAAATAETSTIAGSKTEDASAQGTDPVNASESETPASTGASVREAPAGVAISTGGAQSSTKSESIAERGGPRDGSNGRQQLNDSTAKQEIGVDTLAAPRSTAPPRPKISPPPSNIADVAMPQTSFTAVTAPSLAPAELTEPPSTMEAIALTALATSGLSPLAPDDPLTPVDSPLGLALLALGARTRTPEEQTFAAAAMTAAVNSAPIVPGQPIGTPHPLTGVVTGTVLASDPESDPLTYAVVNGPASGAVELNPQTGTYTYTPTLAARLAAWATPTADTDTFTVAVTDGQQTTTASVSVYIAPNKFENKTPIAVGANPSSVVVGADGRMYVANTGSNTISVINTATNQKIDANSSWFATAIAVGSAPSALALSADGKRLYVANTGSNTVSVINTTTYGRIDANPSWFATDIAVGSAPSALALGTDGRLYVANRGSNTVSVINTTTYALVDTNTSVAGVQSIPVGSAPSALVLGPGGRLYVANRSSNTVSVVDTSNYSVANTITVGSQPSGLTLADDGRLFVANAGSNTVSVFNTVTNTFGANAISVGPAPTSVALSADGKLAYVANTNDTVSVIDTSTYTVVSSVTIDSDTTGGHGIAVSPNGTVYVTDAADNTVRALVIRGNAAPIAGTPTVGAPNSETGAVTGALNFSDTDKDTLSYSVTTQPASGTVTVNAAGTYTYIPNQAARRQAAQTPGADFATFTVNAADGQANTPVSVTVPITPPVAGTGVTVIGGVTVTGDNLPPQQVLSADGSRAVIIKQVTNSWTLAKTTRVTVVNTATGTQIGTTLSLAGAGRLPVMAADGTRALITTSVPNTTTGIETTRVTVINTATGTQIGSTLTFAGSPAGTVLSGTDSSRALIVTDVYDVYDWSPPVPHATGVAVINTTTGMQVGTTVILTGSPTDSMLLGASGSRALVTASTTEHTTQVAVISTTSGIQTGTTLTLAGDRSYASPVVSTDGTRALITTVVPNTTGYGATQVTVIDTTTGTEAATALTLTGSPRETLLLGANGTRALITTYDQNLVTGASTARVASVNMTAGTQTGTTLTLSGLLEPVKFTADGIHALVTSVDGNESTGFTTLVAVFNATTGTQVGTTNVVAGRAGVVPLSDDGTRTLITTSAGEFTTQVAVVNPTTGTQIGTTINVAGALSDVLVNVSAGRAVITTSGPNPAAGGTHATRVAVMDTMTGTQIGTTLTLAGEATNPPYSQLTADGSRAVIATPVYRPGGGTIDKDMRVAVINTSDGKLIGTILTLPGGFTTGPPLLAADGTRAIVTTDVFNGVNRTYSTRVAVINTTTGTQTGTTLTLNYRITYGPILLSANGTHALLSYGTSSIFGNATQLLVINTITGTQTATLSVSGSQSSQPLITADGSRALFVTRISSTSTRITVLRIV